MDIGFYISDIQHNNKNIILQAINEYIKKHPYDNVVVFNNVFNQIPNNLFYTLHLSHAKYFDGILFVFDIKDAAVTKDFPRPKKQIFFMDTPYWQQNRNTRYKLWESIFMNPDTLLVTNNDQNYNLCSICWKSPLMTITNFNQEAISNVIEKIR
jgi:hypothetical protein